MVQQALQSLASLASQAILKQQASTSTRKSQADHTYEINDDFKAQDTLQLVWGDEEAL